MMTTATVLILTIALTATVTISNAATVVDNTLPFSIFADGPDKCDGKTLGTGTIIKLTSMGDGEFCENTIQNLETGDKLTVYTKVKITSCAAIEMGYVFLDAHVCSDSACSDCTDQDGIPVQANLIVPKFEPLPTSDTCWGVEASSTGVTVLNQFDASADPDDVDTYWKVYLENSCLKDSVTLVSDSSNADKPTESAASLATPIALATSTGFMLAASFF